MDALTKQEKFFYDHGGYSYKPGAETQEQGRIRCARELAVAETRAKDAGFEYEWSDDWAVGSHKEYFGKGSAYEDGEPSTCESCVLRNEDGDVLASLGCIDDADADYRRVVEAELADEAFARIDKENAREAGYAATGVLARA